MIEFLSAFIAVIVAFIAGMVCRPRGNFRPIDRKEYDEKWIGEPPPWHLGGSMGEKPPPSVPMPTGGIAPRTIVHLYAPWKK